MGDSQATPRPLTERRRGGVPLRILVADDERDTVDALSLILKNQGHIVHGVYSGKDVLSAVTFFRPDAIIMDIAIPGMSGYAVAQAIRSSFTDIRRPLMDRDFRLLERSARPHGRAPGRLRSPPREALRPERSAAPARAAAPQWAMTNATINRKILPSTTC
jgi:CheY-like chemotaxis protein